MWGNLNALRRIQEDEAKRRRHEEQKEAAKAFASKVGSISIVYWLFSKFDAFNQESKATNFILFAIFLQFTSAMLRAAKTTIDIYKNERELSRLQQNARISNKASDYYHAATALLNAGKLEAALQQLRCVEKNQTLYELTQGSIVDVGREFLKSHNYKRAYETLYSYVKIKPNNYSEKLLKSIAKNLMTQPAERCFAMADYFSQQGDYQIAYNILVLMPEKIGLKNMFSPNEPRDYYIAQLKAAKVSVEMAKKEESLGHTQNEALKYTQARHHALEALQHSETKDEAEKFFKEASHNKKFPETGCGDNTTSPDCVEPNNIQGVKP